MLSDKTSVLQLVALMSQHGIQDVVLCPGSRNAAITHTFSQLSQFECHSITDERSAGFFALGLALAKQRTVAVCVTSGSALLNLHPAVAEAFYQQVPLLIISADRPAAWIGQMDGQTMPQPDCLGQMVKRSVNLPEVHTEEEAWHCNRIINEAILECCHRTKGPVHINVPISEPLYSFTAELFPKVRKIQRVEGLYPSHLRQLAELLGESSRRMIVIGQKPADRQIRPPYMNELSRGFVSLSEHLANTGEGSVALRITDALLDEVETAGDEAFCPDLVITICGHIVSKRMKNFLRKHPPRQHWHISPDGSVVDLFGCLTTVVEAKPYEFLEALAYLMISVEEDNPYPSLWNGAAGRAAANNQTLPSSEAALVGRLCEMLPENAVLHLANSSSVRYAQYFALPTSVSVCCNRGINGIEGSLSAAVGFATATPERQNFVIIGDLSFFYDQNALWNRSLPQNLHILLLNNGGGKIFETLPVPQDAKSRSLIMARHQTQAKAAAEQYGLVYLTGEDNLQAFVNCKQSVILEVIF